MAENKSRFERAIDWLNTPTDARIRREQKGLLINQSEYSYLNQAVMGYNTQSGYFDHKKLAELGDGTGNLYGNFLSRFIFSLDLTLHCSVSILFRHFSCLASSVIFSFVSRILCIVSHLTERS